MLTALKQHYVNHTDGFTMHYGHPLNSDYINHQINLIRQHFFQDARDHCRRILAAGVMPTQLHSWVWHAVCILLGLYYWGLPVFYRGQTGQASYLNLGPCAFEEMRVEIVVMAKVIVFVDEN